MFAGFPFSSRKFQSTLPVRGGTGDVVHVLSQIAISIHPPRAGRDRSLSARLLYKPYFNPPSPCGEGLCFPVTV